MINEYNYEVLYPFTIACKECIHAKQINDIKLQCMNNNALLNDGSHCMGHEESHSLKEYRVEFSFEGSYTKVISAHSKEEAEEIAQDTPISFNDADFDNISIESISPIEHEEAL